jgi:hypothetical protein
VRSNIHDIRVKKVVFTNIGTADLGSVVLSGSLVDVSSNTPIASLYSISGQTMTFDLMDDFLSG